VDNKVVLRRARLVAWWVTVSSDNGLILLYNAYSLPWRRECVIWLVDWPGLNDVGVAFTVVYQSFSSTSIANSRCPLAW